MDRDLIIMSHAAVVNHAVIQAHAFSVVAPALWNPLPLEVKQTPTLLCFHCLLKTFIFSHAIANLPTLFLQFLIHVASCVLKVFIICVTFYSPFLLV